MLIWARNNRQRCGV